MHTWRHRAQCAWTFPFVTHFVKEAVISCNTCFWDCPLPCRYAAQNAKALEEAKTALETGEIRTPSLPSPESSAGGEGDYQSAERGFARTTSDCASSGEQYEVGTSDSSTSGSTPSSAEDGEHSYGNTLSTSIESSLGTEDTTIEGTYSEYSSSNGEEDYSDSEDSCYSKQNPEIWNRNF